MIANTKKDRDSLGPDEILCDHCTAKCCKYFALPIETPVDFEDYEFIRWYLVHDRATVFTDDDQWYIMIHTTCRHLQTDNRCGIYETRPQICRDYTKLPELIFLTKTCFQILIIWVKNILFY